MDDPTPNGLVLTVGKVADAKGGACGLSEEENCGCPHVDPNVLVECAWDGLGVPNGAVVPLDEVVVFVPKPVGLTPKAVVGAIMLGDVPNVIAELYCAVVCPKGTGTVGDPNPEVPADMFIAG